MATLTDSPPLDPLSAFLPPGTDRVPGLPGHPRDWRVAAFRGKPGGFKALLRGPEGDFEAFEWDDGPCADGRTILAPARDGRRPPSRGRSPERKPGAKAPKVGAPRAIVTYEVRRHPDGVWFDLDSLDVPDWTQGMIEAVAEATGQHAGAVGRGAELWVYRAKG